MATGGGGGRERTGGQLFAALRRRALAANAIGATVAYVYLGFVAPPQPQPEDSELVEYLFVGPAYFVLAVLVGHQISKRTYRRVQHWLAEDRPPTGEERALVLTLPWRAAGLAAAGWITAALVFGGQT